MKKMIILAALLLIVSARAGDLTTDNLTVSKDAAVYGKLDFYSIAASTNTNGVVATGGTITTNGNYRIHTFTNSGTFEVSDGSLNCDVLVVAGGGGGGRTLAGGGGAGGFRTFTELTLTSGVYSVIVGDGGMSSDNSTGTDGSNSVFGTNTATGGGGGGKGSTSAENGRNGGSGGGGGGNNVGAAGVGGAGNTPSTDPSQGNEGGSGATDYGWGAGGGGGAGGVGGNGTGSNGGAGGAGITSSISGSAVGYAGGGGGDIHDGTGGSATCGGGKGGSTVPNVAAEDGAANTGGGGGGGNITAGRTGGSGIVIVRYLINQTTSSNITTLTVSSNGINQANTSGANTFMSKVGIGTNNPAEKLHVAGNVQVDGTNIVSAITAAQVGALSTNAGALIAANNLSDVANAGTARSNLGLGSAATKETSAFLSTTGGVVNGDISLVSPAGDIPMGIYTNQ